MYYQTFLIIFACYIIDFNVISMESLFTNALAFEFPKDPKIFYFSKKDREAVSLTKLSHQLFPCNIKEIFPDISNVDTIYTSFEIID